MNYYEHRLMEIKQQITALSSRNDTQYEIQKLQQERNKILKTIHGEDI